MFGLKCLRFIIFTQHHHSRSFHFVSLPFAMLKYTNVYICSPLDLDVDLIAHTTNIKHIPIPGTRMIHRECRTSDENTSHMRRWQRDKHRVCVFNVCIICCDRACRTCLTTTIMMMMMLDGDGAVRAVVLVYLWWWLGRFSAVSSDRTGLCRMECASFSVLSECVYVSVSIGLEEPISGAHLCQKNKVSEPQQKITLNKRRRGSADYHHPCCVV